VSETSAVVDVIGPHHCPSQFLKKVVLLIGTLCRSQKGDAIWSVLLFDLLEARSDMIEGLIPGYLFELPFSLHERFAQPGAAIDEFVDIPSFDAKPSLADRISFAGDGSYQFSIQNLQVEATTTPTIAAGR